MLQFFKVFIPFVKLVATSALDSLAIFCSMFQIFYMIYYGLKTKFYEHHVHTRRCPKYGQDANQFFYL